MLNDKIVSLLNNQVAFEFYSSNLYLQMSAWADVQGLDGCAAFLSNHAREEFQHGLKLFSYINETGTMAEVGSIDAPPSEFGSVGELFQMVYDHEKLVTARINELVRVTDEENDYSTLNFLQWYVAEQHEEEHLISQILDKIKIVGEEGSGVYFIDRAIGEIARRGG